jgi:hypothetical protein
MFQNWCAIGIRTGLGLTLFYCNSADAQPHSVSAQRQEIQHRHVRLSFHRHEADHPQATTKRQKERDGTALLSLKVEIRDLRKQVVEVELLRRELTDLKEKIWGPTPLPLSLSVLPRPQSVTVVEPKRVTLKLPDLGEPYRPQAPVNPVSASSPAVIEERATEVLKPKSAVEEAKAYLIETATPGYTMVRQGVPGGNRAAASRFHRQAGSRRSPGPRVRDDECRRFFSVPAPGLRHRRFQRQVQLFAQLWAGSGHDRHRRAGIAVCQAVADYSAAGRALSALRAGQPRGIQSYAISADQNGTEFSSTDHHGGRTQEPATHVAGVRHQLLRGGRRAYQVADPRQRIGRAKSGAADSHR